MCRFVERKLRKDGERGKGKECIVEEFHPDKADHWIFCHYHIYDHLQSDPADWGGGSGSRDNL